MICNRLLGFALSIATFGACSVVKGDPVWNTCPISGWNQHAASKHTCLTCMWSWGAKRNRDIERQFDAEEFCDKLVMPYFASYTSISESSHDDAYTKTICTDVYNDVQRIYGDKTFLSNVARCMPTGDLLPFEVRILSRSTNRVYSDHKISLTRSSRSSAVQSLQRVLFINGELSI